MCETRSHLWSFRQLAKAGDFWWSSPKKWETCMEVGADLEPAIWFYLILYSCHGSLASRSLDHFFIVLFHLGNLVFYNTSESKNLRKLCWMAAVICEKIRMKFTFFSQQARTQELVVIKTSYVIILLIIIFSHGLGGGGVSIYPMN